MSQHTARLERLLADELGECCDGDVEDRLAALRTYRSETPVNSDTDLTAMKTLGDDTRHTIVRLLDVAGREMCVCELDHLVDVSDSAISHALSDLSEAGLVTRRKAGTWRYYDVTDRARALLAALDETREDDR